MSLRALLCLLVLFPCSFLNAVIPNSKWAIYENGFIVFGAEHEARNYIAGDKVFVPSFSLESYGATLVRFDVQDPVGQPLVFWVEGPFIDEYEAESVPVGSGPLYLQIHNVGDGELEFPISFQSAGIYRFLISRPSWFTPDGVPTLNDNFNFRTNCLANCFVPFPNGYSN